MLYLTITAATMAAFADALITAGTYTYGVFEDSGRLRLMHRRFNGLAADGRFRLSDILTASAPETRWSIRVAGDVPDDLLAAALDVHVPAYTSARR